MSSNPSSPASPANPAAPPGPKMIKKGEYLFKEGDKIQNIHIVQSGSLSVTLTKSRKNMELFIVGAGNVLGDTGINNPRPVYPYNAIATSETKILEIPLEGFKQAIEGSAQPLKVLVKTLLDRNKAAFNEIKTYKSEKESSPCPDEFVAKVYGAIFHTANHKGLRANEKPSSFVMAANVQKEEEHPKKVTVDWLMMRQYAQRIFGESARRMENAISVLIKLKMAEFEMGSPPEDPEGELEIQKVHFYDLAPVEAFFEFYQYHYFKNGRSEILKVDEACSIILNELLKSSKETDPDRFGMVTLDFQKTVEKFKTDININLTADHFVRLEAKGLFVKRGQRNDGSVILQFDLNEFNTTQKIWQIIREIDKWNEKGFVDMDEDVSVKTKSKPSSCPQCNVESAPNAKFCIECGFKIAA